VAYNFAGLSPEKMAVCLNANNVIETATGMVRPHNEFGISATAAKTVNRSIAAALTRIAEAERASMVEKKISEFEVQYRLPANARQMELELKEIGSVLHRNLSPDVSAGVLAAMRGTLAFKSYGQEHVLSVNTGKEGILLSTVAGVKLTDSGMEIPVSITGDTRGFLGREATTVSEAAFLNLSSWGWSEEHMQNANLRWSHLARVVKPAFSGPQSAVERNNMPVPFAVLEGMK
jgi:hypothetical protein